MARARGIKGEPVNVMKNSAEREVWRQGILVGACLCEKPSRVVPGDWGVMVLPRVYVSILGPEVKLPGLKH